MMIARERDNKALEQAMSRFIPPHCHSYPNHVKQAKYSFLQSKREELQSVFSQETTLISSFRSGGAGSNVLATRSKRKRMSKSYVLNELFGSESFCTTVD